MSKLSYEDALKESKDFGSFVGLKLDKVNNALEQAQKQEKLLKLYKELSNYVCEQCYAHELPEITRLKIIIKELEK